MRWKVTGPPLALYAAIRPTHAMQKKSSWNSRDTGGPLHIVQRCDCGQYEYDAAGENGRQRERILRQQKRNGAGKRQWQIRCNEFDAAVNGI